MQVQRTIFFSICNYYRLLEQRTIIIAKHFQNTTRQFTCLVEMKRPRSLLWSAKFPSVLKCGCAWLR